MTNYLFQRNQQNKTKGLIQLHYVSFEDLISVTKYEKSETTQAGMAPGYFAKNAKAL